MKRFISRDPWESDKRIGVNWWLKDDEPCDYCLYKKSKICDHCIYNKKKRMPLIY